MLNKQKHMILMLLLLIAGVGQVWGQSNHTEQYDYDGDGVNETYNVVYLTVGGSNGNGNSSATPVNSWANAYKKLPNYTGTTDADRDEAWEHNIIVVQNTTVSSALIQIDETIAKGNGTQGIPATITGVWPWTAEKTTATNVTTNGGMVTLHNHVDPSSTASNNPTRIGADTKFKYIRFGGQSNCFLSMYLHDCTFDVGCVMNITNDLIPSNGALKIGNTTRKAPDMQVFLFANTYTFKSGTTDGGFNALMKKPVTLTIKSGKFGRILSNRVTGVGDSYFKTRYVVGNPNNPLTCIVNVDIDPETSTGDWNTKGYVDDIAFLCAGMTQGAEYADVQFNIKRGKITTLVGAMQGNTVNTSSASLSNSSYFGRTETNILAENDNDVTIYRYYAACFGRMTKGQFATANAAFYGKSTLNMYGGTIENGAYVSAGGVSGLVSPYNPEDYTNDQYIPYVDNTSTYRNYPYMGVHYQPYDKNKSMVHVKSMLHRNDGEEPEDIDLSETVTQMNIYGGVVRGGVFGGSYGFSPELMVDYAMSTGGSIWGETNVNIYGGHIYDGVYGGGEGSSNFYNLATAANRDKFTTVATVYGNTNVNIYGGIIEGGIYGGGKGLDSQTAGKIVTITTTDGTDPVTKDVTTVANEFLNIAKVYGKTNVTIDPKTLKPRAEWADPNVPEFVGPNSTWTFTGNIYGGGAKGAVEGSTNVQVLGGNITGNVFAGGLGEDGHANKAKVTGNTEANIQGGTQGSEYAVYGGAQMAQVVGNTTVNLLGGTVGSAYGGGLGTETMAANITGNTQVNLGAMEDDGEGNLIATGNATVNNIFGCNNLNGTPSGTDTVNVISGTVNNNVYGGGNQANASVSPVVNIKGGTVTNDVYGGGALANVSGNTTVNLTGGTIGNSYGGGLGSNEVAAIVNGDASTTLNGSKVTGFVFGANNVNGTPKGHVKVHVLSTTPRDGQTAEQYDVAAVYGGGNQAAYVPSDETFTAEKGYTEVLIENCDNSIEYVYGGGNAAPVPATEVTIYGANAINDAFAGGNGAGAGNPGADIGYNGYYSKTREETPTYGTGITRITVYGGTVNNVFGGSNTLGYVREHAYVGVLERPQDYEGAECVSNVGEVYGAGNRAVMYCPSTVEMACSQGAEEIYGGAKQVDFFGDVNLIIVSGTYGKVFGGNNISGNVHGSITINVDETGCFPVKIGELYGGGNLAAYSVYGYDNEGHCITRESDMPDPTKKYADPTINLISFTEIGKVFGGGLGETAVMYGDPVLNINPIKGKPAGDTSDAVGTIGTIYGGGNEAAVYGNTNVNIATKATNKHLNADPGAEPEKVDALITGNVYGGGSQADVHGDTNVTIGE